MTPISNPNNHLNTYRFQPNIPNPKGLTIANQFGWTECNHFRPPCSWPSPRESNSLPPPSGLDHFRRYPAIVTPGAVNRPIPRIRVTLKDQFDKQPEVVNVLGVVACPCTRRQIAQWQITSIQNPDDHLTCYVFEETTTAPVMAPVAPAGVVFTQNQFGTERFFVKQARYLCVPTLKQVVAG